jgi:hypothetical protein
MAQSRLQELDALYERTNEWDDPRRNPHVWGQLVGNDFQARRGYYSARALALERRVSRSTPSSAYYRRGNEERTLVHWGQRKLLLAEIEFLTLYGHLSKTVVYAGAAPGTHLAILAALFPNHAFHLYDPAPFNLREGRNIHLHQEMFLDTVAESWRRDVLFICDIRSANLELQTHEEFEERVVADMEAQRHWCELMRPVMASLKFRPPWDDKTLEYYSGDIYFQIWAAQKSTETRLFTNCRSTQQYSNSLYADQLFHHNIITRLSLHPHEVKDVYGLDHCGDCAAEILVLRRYVERYGLPGYKEVVDLDHAVGALCSLITHEMKGGRTLGDQIDHREQRRRIEKNQWTKRDDGSIKPAYADADGYLLDAEPVNEQSAAYALMEELINSPSVAATLDLQVLNDIDPV